MEFDVRAGVVVVAGLLGAGLAGWVGGLVGADNVLVGREVDAAAPEVKPAAPVLSGTAMSGYFSRNCCRRADASCICL